MTNDTYSENRHINLGTWHIWTHLIGFHGNIPRLAIAQLGISLISCKLVCFNISVTNETFCRIRHIYLGFSIFGHILKDFMEIFQDGAFPNLEYHFISSDLVFFSID